MEKVTKPIVLNETFSEKLDITNDFLSSISQSCKTISADVPKVTTGTSADGSTTITVENKDGTTTTKLVDGTARASVNTLSARMDTFTSLPEGSTSGNAELADIRVGANGTTYDTAGNAVRGQIGELKSDLSHIEEVNEIKYSHFRMEKNVEHSSINDKVPVNLKNGDTIEVWLKSPEITTSVTASLYANGSAFGNLYVNADMPTVFDITNDVSEIGCYVPPVSVDAGLIFIIRCNSTIVKLDNRTNGMESIIVCDEITQGSWSSHGIDNDNIRLCSKNAHKVKRGDVLSALTNGLYLNVGLWDRKPTSASNATLLKGTGWIGDDFTFKCEYDGYITFQVGNAKSYGESTEIIPSDYTCKVSIMKDLFETNGLKPTTVLDSEIVQGAWETTGVALDDRRICSKTPYAVKKGDYLFVNPKDKYLFIVVWDKEPSTASPANSLQSVGWVGGKPFIYNVENDGYLTVQFANGSNYGTSTAIIPNEYNCDVELFSEKNLGKEVFESVFSLIDDTTQQIEDVKNRIGTLPDYWVEYMNSKIVDIFNNSSECALNGDSFMFFTDYHIEQNSGLSHLLMKEIADKTTVKDVVFGGDIYNGSATKAETLSKARTFVERFSSLNVFGTRGNHEYNWNDGGSESVEMTESEIYNELVKSVEHSVTTDGRLSFYRDNPNRKIRYIFVDSHYESDTSSEKSIISSEELEWVKSRMLELEEGWGVVIFTHIIFGMHYNENPVQYASNGQRIINAINSVKDSMSAEIICVICGHVHYDYSNTDNGYLIITTTCDSKQDSGQWIDWGAGAGTIKEHAFDVFSINRTTRQIKTTRIGRGVDRSWNY